MSPDTREYHRDIGFPADAAMPAPGLRLAYSPHAQTKARAEGIRLAELPAVLGMPFEVLQLTTVGRDVAHWRVRMPIRTRPGKVLVAVVARNGFVLTVWVKTTWHKPAVNQRRFSNPESGARMNTTWLNKIGSFVCQLCAHAWIAPAPPPGVVFNCPKCHRADGVARDEQAQADHYGPMRA